MSASGHMRTFCNAGVMSALPPKCGHGVAPSKQTSFAIAAMASGRRSGDCVPQPKFCSLGVRMIFFDLGATQSRRSRPCSEPTLAVCAVLGLFAASVQRL